MNNLYLKYSHDNTPLEKALHTRYIIADTIEERELGFVVSEGTDGSNSFITIRCEDEAVTEIYSILKCNSHDEI